MPADCYAFDVRTIEEIRLANFKLLTAELADLLKCAPKPPAIAEFMGISKVYAWQLVTGKRTNIESKAARDIEAKTEKPTGWMDTDFSLWPFPDIDPARIDGLTVAQRAELQVLLRQSIETFEAANAKRLSRPNGSTGHP